MKSYLPLVIILSLFFLLKLTTFGIRMSDTNIYFYTAYELLQGKTLYKDIFFTNFPLFPYISILYLLLLGKSLSLYFFTSVLETSAVAGIIYYLSLKHTKSLLISTFSTFIYLFSFIVLSTSDHQTGVFLASLFAIFSYFFFDRKQYKLTGCFAALMVLTKAYFIPILATYVVFFLIKQRKALLPFLLSLLLTTFIILLPSLLFARADFIRDVFVYSLTRSQGLSKTNIFWFFITHDILLFLTFLAAFTQVRKQLFFFIFSLFSFLFLLLYQDIYFLYLNFAIPFLCLFFAFFYHDALAKLSLQKMVVPTIITVLLFYNLTTYISGYRNLERFQSLEDMKQTISSLHPAFLYGTNDTAPALAYLTNTPLLNNIVDTNENIFRKGFLNASEQTKDALSQHALFIGHGIDYPESGINQPLISEIFDLKQMAKYSCKLVGSFPIQTEDITNRINFVSCEK